jgi:putative spermidine/putrescine transport system substrate-binding protein
MGSRSRLAGFVGAAALAMLAAAAHAQNAPPAGTVVDGSLKGKTLTFVSYGGIYRWNQAM